MSILQNEILKFIDRFVAKALVTVNGKKKEYQFTKSYIEGDTLRKFVYVDLEDNEVVTSAVAVDSQGRPLEETQIDISNANNGFVIAFMFKQTVTVEVADVG